MRKMMKWIKAILATTVSFLICYYWGKFSGFTGFSFAWILNFVLMIWFTYLNFLFRWKYNSSYFNVRPFENGGSLYTFLGVHLYRKLLVWVGWEKLNKKNCKIINKSSALQYAEYKTRSSETGHTLIFFIVALVTLLVAKSLRDALWLIILNLLLNLYPVIVQRYNRPRYKRLLQKMELQQPEA